MGAAIGVQGFRDLGLLDFTVQGFGASVAVGSGFWGGGGLRVSEFGGLGFWTYSQLSESRLKGWRSGVLNDDS